MDEHVQFRLVSNEFTAAATIKKSNHIKKEEQRNNKLAWSRNPFAAVEEQEYSIWWSEEESFSKQNNCHELE